MRCDMLVQWYYWKASFTWMIASRFYASYKPLIAAILASYSHYFNQPASKSIIRFLYPAPISSFLNHALITNWSERFISICNALNCHIFQQCTGVISTFAILLRFDSYSAFSAATRTIRIAFTSYGVFLKTYMHQKKHIFFF